jgi:hypothetical protein
MSCTNCGCGRTDPFLCDACRQRAERLIQQHHEQQAALQHELLCMIWREKARHGDVDAILALPDGREAASTRGLNRFTTKRKAIAEAKQRMEQRRLRRQARAIANTAPMSGRILARQAMLKARQLKAWKEQAVAIGIAYHLYEKPLYASKRASVVYGYGGQEGEDRDAYSKAYRSKFGGAKWRNAGARLDNEERPTMVILENYLGMVVARVPFKLESEKQDSLPSLQSVTPAAG